MKTPAQLTKTASSPRTSPVTWPTDNKAIGTRRRGLIAGFLPVVSILAQRIPFSLLFLGAGLVLVRPCAGASVVFEETGGTARGRSYHTAASSGGSGDDLIGEEAFRAFHFLFNPPAPVARPRMFPLLSGPAVFPDEFRSIDGTGNNQINPLWGSTNTAFFRETTNGYGDGSGTPGGAGQRGARDISNLVDDQGQGVSVPIVEDVTDFVWQWGQFLDHDLTLTPVAVPADRFPIPVPECDPDFDPGCTGTKTLSFQRSAFVMINNVREQVNVTTAFIDGSQVYGPDEDAGG